MGGPVVGIVCSTPCLAGTEESNTGLGEVTLGNAAKSSRIVAKVLDGVGGIAGDLRNPGDVKASHLSPQRPPEILA